MNRTFKETIPVSKLLWLLLSCPLARLQWNSFIHSFIHKMYQAGEGIIFPTLTQGTRDTTNKQDDRTAASPEPPKFPEHCRICSFLRLGNRSQGCSSGDSGVVPQAHSTDVTSLFTHPQEATGPLPTAAYCKDWKGIDLRNSLSPHQPSASSHPGITHLEAQTCRKQKPGTSDNTKPC